MREDGNHMKEVMRLIIGILDHFPAFVLAVDKNKDVLYCNAEAARVMGKDVQKNALDQLLAGYDVDQADGKCTEFEIEMDNAWYKISAVKADWFDGRQAHLIMGVDITQIKHSEAAFMKSAKTDAMTGIHNRQSGLDFLEQAIRDVKNGGYQFTACYFDINDLKYTNDKFGHAEGDAYIQAVVAVVKNSIRQTDIFARMGGDEFLIIFPKCQYEVVDNIMSTVMTRFDVINDTSENKHIRYSISYGILEINEGIALETEYILNTLDDKMYKMKEAYKKTRKLPH